MSNSTMVAIVSAVRIVSMSVIVSVLNHEYHFGILEYIMIGALAILWGVTGYAEGWFDSKR